MDGDSIVMPAHARKQAEKRGISEGEVIEAFKKGEIIFSEKNGRFGTKNYSKIELYSGSIVCVWFGDEKGRKRAVTAYWRRRK